MGPGRHGQRLYQQILKTPLKICSWFPRGAGLTMKQDFVKSEGLQARGNPGGFSAYSGVSKS